jgi:hypothetical protein
MGGSGGRGVSGEIVQGLAAMMQDEPVVRQAISVLQHHCLSGGLHLRFGMDPRTHVPPTPSFARHLDYYYLQFCRRACAFFSLSLSLFSIRAAQRSWVE